jgi:dTDP-4-amino-4,6-dideoxygalactose transaminase
LLLVSDPKANYLAHKQEIDQAIQRVLDSGQYVLGFEVSAFEQEFARYLGAQYAVGTGTGTDALHLALRACDIGPGDAVITVSHTAVATVAAIELTGATAVLVDVDSGTYTMDPKSLEDTIAALTASHSPIVSHLKAIIPVHLYGHPAEMSSIMEVARRHDLYVIEDCAQSHGASIQGRKTGSWGDLSIFSFYPTKNLGALGDGGAIVTSNPDFAQKIRLLREYGWRERYVSALPGTNSRLDEIQAAILRVKLHHLETENATRRELARIYDALLPQSRLTIPKSRGDVKHAYHQYVVRTKHRDPLMAFLKANSVGTLIHYPMPVHLQPAYRGRVVTEEGGLRNSEQICREILSLPMHPQLTHEQIREICELMAKWQTEVVDSGV